MKKLVIFLFVSALFLINSQNFFVFSQEITKYGISNGLSSDEVTSVCKNENFIWIGTTDGLSRFDGLKFKVYKKTNSAKNGISSNNIEFLMPDSDGRIWIGYKTTGIDLYNPKTDKFIPGSELVDKTLPHRVISIFEDSNHTIWIGSWEEGIFQLIPDENRTKYTVFQHYQGNIISSFLEKPKGFLWIGTYYGGILYNLMKKSWSTFGAEQTITSLVDGGENEIFYSTWDKGIKKITFQEINNSLSDIIEKNFYTSPVIISKMLKLRDQSLALGSWGDGLSFLKNNKDHLVSSDGDNSGIDKPGYINTLFADESGTLWVCTYGNGLLRYSQEGPVIEKFIFPTSITTPVSSIYRLPWGKILIGTRGQGCFIIDQETHSMRPEKYNSGNISGSYLLSALCVDNLLILGSDDMGLACNLQNGERFRNNSAYKMILNGNQFGKISAIFRHRDKFYFGTKQNGFFTAFYDQITKGFVNLQQHSSVGRDEVTGFAEFSENKVWISTHYGLYLYNQLTDSLENYSAHGINEAVYCIKNDTIRNRIWAGTSSGPYFIDNNTKETAPVDAYGILPSGSVKTLILDRKSNLWFTIANRLFFYNVDSTSLVEVDISRTVSTPVISSEIVIENQKELLLIGSSEGVTRVDIDAIYNIRNPAKILLTDIDIDLRRIHVGDTIYGKVPLKESAEYIRELRLSYKCKWISFYFTGIGENIIKSHYQYRIDGFSKNWENFEITNPITISQLPGGNYRLDVRHYSGESSEETMWSMKLGIIPPFWQTIWFRVIELTLILLLFLIFALALQKRYKRKLSSRLTAVKKEQELELLKEKESFFIGLSHDILTPFTLILSPAKDLYSDRTITKENKKKVEVIVKNANFLSDMFSTILDFKQAENADDTLNLRQFELISFSKIILNSFQYLADSKNIKVSFGSNIDSLKVNTDSVKYERILYNLLGNSLKYTPEYGVVSLTINSNIENIEIIIEDNGYGIATLNKDRIFEKFYRGKGVINSGNSGLGLGLYIVKKYVTVLGGEIILNSSGKSGTSFSVFLPNKIICDQNNRTLPAEPRKYASEISSEDLKPTLLIVEDNDDMRNYLFEKLSSGFNIKTAGNGIEAIQLTKEVMPEVIISDLMMPGMDGLTLCRKIKENESLSDIFFILITAKNSHSDEVNSYKEGVDIFIRKPFDIDVLEGQITNIISTRLKQKRQILQKLFLQKGDPSAYDTKDLFIREAMKIVDENISDSDFKLEEFASRMNLSLTVLHRKFKVLLGETPNQFIKTVRLKKAENLLVNSDLTISEITYLTGFSQSHYFIKCFKEIHNETPKVFRKNSKHSE